MLDQKVIEQPNSIEEYFCKPFEAIKVEEMSKETSEILINLLMGNLQEIPEEEKPFIMKLIEKRIEVIFDYTITDQKLLLFLSALSETPGKAVMYMTYLQYFSKKHGIKDIDLDIFCQKAFPWGFPPEKALHELWIKQKVDVKSGSNNLLDYGTALESILEEKETA